MSDEPIQPVVTRRVLHVLPGTPVHPCAYLPGRVARDRGFAVESLHPTQWQILLESGWRRAGAMIYEPICFACKMCIPLRIAVSDFKANRSQRRCLRRNRDLDITIQPMQVTDERAELYRRYIKLRHTGLMTGSRREFEQFLGLSPVETFELEYRHEDRLVAVGTVDRIPSGWSCVYCYYEPDEERRSLGTLNVLKAIEWCRDFSPAGDEAYVYLGYWVPGSETMAYKTNFRPYQTLAGNGEWIEPASENEAIVSRERRSSPVPGGQL
jgi:arginyl-tRNA--protein-N-Asp/Glu arginylyltransferase